MKNQTKRNNPVTITNYEKHFNDFASMIIELKSIHPEIDLIFGIMEEDAITPVDSILCLIDYCSNGRIPDALTGANLPCALSFSANRASVKTMHFISFGYNFKYNRDKEITDIVANVAVYSKENNSEELLNTIDILTNKENGWKEMPPKR